MTRSGISIVLQIVGSLALLAALVVTSFQNQEAQSRAAALRLELDVANVQIEQALAGWENANARRLALVQDLKIATLLLRDARQMLNRCGQEQAL